MGISSLINHVVLAIQLSELESDPGTPLFPSLLCRPFSPCVMMLSSVPADPRGGQQLPGSTSVGPCPSLSQLYHEQLATGCRETSKDQKTAAAGVGPLMTMSLRPAESKARDGNLGMDSGGREQQIPVEHRQSTLGSVSSLRGHVYGTAGSADFRRTERQVSDQVWNVCLVFSV